MLKSSPLGSTLIIPPERAMNDIPTAPDSSWRVLYWAGGVSAFLYIVLAVVVPALLFLPMGYERGLDGRALLTLVADHRLSWIVLQTLMLGVASFLGIITFTALFMSLKDLNKSVAALGALITITYHVVVIAYLPVTLGIAYLSDLYTRSGVDRQESLAAAAEGLVAVIDAFNPLYEGALAVGILLLSVAMLRGVYHRYLAYLGIATCIAALIGISLFPVIGFAYFGWWLLFAVWFIAVGWRLLRLGSA